MTLQIYYFFLAFQVGCAAGGAVILFLMWKLGLRPRLAYALICSAFLLRIITVIPRVYYADSIVLSQGVYPLWLVIAIQAIETIIVACFAAGMLMKYAGYRRHGLVNKKTVEMLNSEISTRLNQ